jgi:hypothetical protein
MNERIKQLAEQAGFLNKDEESIGYFAELIIKETLQVARAGVEFGNGMEDAVYNYFGVEE